MHTPADSHSKVCHASTAHVQQRVLHFKEQWMLQGLQGWHTGKETATQFVSAFQYVVPGFLAVLTETEPATAMLSDTQHLNMLCNGDVLCEKA